MTDPVRLRVPADMAARAGTVHLVGAGPGDAGLITLRGAALLATADLVLHDQLVSDDVLAMVRPGAEVVPVGRRCGHVVTTHEDVVTRMVDGARRGQRVIRLKGGDPMVFGRGAEESRACVEAHVDVVVVPGISSALAGPAAAGIPVTHRDLARGFLVVTASTCDDTDIDWEPVARFEGTLVILMGRRRWDMVTARLIAAGRDPGEPAAAIANATLPGQQVARSMLATIARTADRLALQTPALLVVGAVTALPTDQDTDTSAFADLGHLLHGTLVT